MEARLTARSVSFPDTFGTYHIQFGKALPSKRFAHKLFKRFIESSEEAPSETKGAMSKALELAREGAERIGEAIIPDIDSSETFRFDINMGTPNELKNIYMDMLQYV